MAAVRPKRARSGRVEAPVVAPRKEVSVPVIATNQTASKRTVRTSARDNYNGSWRAEALPISLAGLMLLIVLYFISIAR